MPKARKSCASSVSNGCLMYDLSILRIGGIAAGLLVLSVSFFYLRGTRWSRSGFILSTTFAAILLLVSLDPASVNGLQQAFSLGDFQYGRLLALLIIAVFAAIMIALYGKARADQLQRTLDAVICANAADKAIEAAAPSSIKPIMIIIPALNEARNFEILLPRIPKEVGGREVGVVVVDDGSVDDTGEVARAFGCLVARNPIRRGQGAACRVGYATLQRLGVEFAVTMDADNQHRPEDLPAMLEPLLTERADFVLGSRRLGSAHGGDGVRAAGITLLSRLLSVLSGRRITDCSSGYKAFRMSLFSRLDLREDQFQNSEVIMEAAKKGLRIVEVPIHITERSHGVSRKGSNMSYGFFFAKAMVKTWWR
jgi:hypothetical protein